MALPRAGSHVDYEWDSTPKGPGSPLCPDMMSPDTMKRCILCGTETEGIEDKVLSKKILSEQQYHPLGLQKEDQEEILLSQNS